MGEIKPSGIMKVALVTGATGLIGSQLLQLLLDDPYYQKVKAVTRKPLNLQHSKLENLVVDFSKLSEQYNLLKVDDVFCCLGTTIKVAKIKEAFRKVDYDYPLEFARLTKGQGAAQFLLVSALGADKYSKVFYNRVKGEVEEAIRQVSFNTLHIFHPSLLLGNRAEQRSGEGAATLFFKLFGFLIPTRFKAIDSLKVARAMLALAKESRSGIYVHESKELQNY